MVVCALAPAMSGKHGTYMVELRLVLSCRGRAAAVKLPTFHANITEAGSTAAVAAARLRKLDETRGGGGGVGSASRLASHGTNHAHAQWTRLLLVAAVLLFLSLVRAARQNSLLRLILSKARSVTRRRTLIPH